MIRFPAATAPSFGGSRVISDFYRLKKKGGGQFNTNTFKMSTEIKSHIKHIKKKSYG